MHLNVFLLLLWKLKNVTLFLNAFQSNHSMFTRMRPHRKPCQMRYKLSTLTPKNFGGKKFGRTNFGHFFDISAENISDTFFKVENWPKFDNYEDRVM